jgi:hypothetical protein
MKLVQLSGADGQSMESAALRAVVIAEMRANAPLLDHAEFYSMVGNADTPEKAATEQGGATRSINVDYDGVTGAPDYGSVSLKVYGDKIKTDMAYERRSASLPKERLRQLISFSGGLGRFVQDHMINGTGEGAQISGLKKLLTGSNVINFMNSEVGSQVILGNDNAAKKSQQQLLNSIDALKELVGPKAILIMAPSVKAYLKSIARDHVTSITLEEALSGQVESYDGTPIINAGYKKNKSDLVIGYNESVGVSNDCTSIYCVAYGEKEDVTLASNVGIVVKDLGLVESQYVTMVDFDIDQTVLSPTAAFRLQGIRLA